MMSSGDVIEMNMQMGICIMNMQVGICNITTILCCAYTVLMSAIQETEYSIYAHHVPGKGTSIQVT